MHNTWPAEIGTIAELKDDLYSYISDASKDVNGVRTRFNYKEATVEYLMAEVEYWNGRVIESIEEDRLREAAAIERFEALIAKTIDMGAKDRETAIRWLTSIDDWYRDPDYFCYEYGLPYGYLNGHIDNARI
jgi:hypothetical protein